MNDGLNNKINEKLLMKIDHEKDDIYDLILKSKSPMDVLLLSVSALSIC